MMTLFYSFFFIFFFNSTCLSSMIIMMIFLSVMAFFSIWVMSGSCWFSIVFSLLFVGGVLVIFMVISSLFPNTKNFSISSKKKFYLSLVFLFLIWEFKDNFFYGGVYMKFLVNSGANFFSFFFLILSYFFCFLYFISKDKISLRSFF